MERDKKLSTTVTEEEKQDVRVRAAKKGLNMSQYIRELVYDDLEDAGYETSRESEAEAEEADSGNVTVSGTAD